MKINKIRKCFFERSAILINLYLDQEEKGKRLKLLKSGMNEDITINLIDLKKIAL